MTLQIKFKFRLFLKITTLRCHSNIILDKALRSEIGSVKPFFIISVGLLYFQIEILQKNLIKIPYKKNKLSVRVTFFWTDFSVHI